MLVSLIFHKKKTKHKAKQRGGWFRKHFQSAWSDVMKDYNISGYIRLQHLQICFLPEYARLTTALSFPFAALPFTVFSPTLLFHISCIHPCLDLRVINMRVCPQCPLSMLPLDQWGRVWHVTLSLHAKPLEDTGLKACWTGMFKLGSVSHYLGWIFHLNGLSFTLKTDKSLWLGPCDFYKWLRW